MSRKFVWLLDSGSAVLVRVERVKVILYIFYICVAGVVNCQNVIHISDVRCDVFVGNLCEVCVF